jgi:hypothetical protein
MSRSAIGRLRVLALLAAAPLLAGCIDIGLGEPELQDEVTVYVYDAHFRLYPVNVEPDGDTWWEAAVNALVTYRPDKTGRYSTLWVECPFGENVDKVTADADLITVHFQDPAGAQCDMSNEAVEIRRQQLAWTMRTATGFEAPVQVTIGDDDAPVEGPLTARERFLAPQFR